MKAIYFVDDEKSVLDGQRRALRDLRQNWELHFHASAAEALAEMERSPPHVVVSDMRMPGMDGAEFLERVRSRFPATVRLVLSGQADLALLTRVTRSAHQILSKPCNLDQLRRVIQGVGPMYDQLADTVAMAAVAGMGELPVIPRVLADLLEVLARPEVDQRVIASAIMDDPGLCLRILQVANSGLFALRNSVQSVEQAVVMLGSQMVKNIVVQVKVSEVLPPSCEGFSAEMFARRVERITRIAIAIRPASVAVDDIRAIVMMADVGQMVLASRMAKEYSGVLREAGNSEDALSAIELRRLGVSHATIGALLMSLWGQDAATVGCIANHHSPSRLVGDSALLRTVHVAEALCECAGSLARAERSLEPAVVAVVKGDLPCWVALAGGALCR